MTDMEAQANTTPDFETPAIFKKANRPVTLQFEDVVYKINLKERNVIFTNKPKSGEKKILKGLSGVVRPGEMLAMLGPSGSGKTTLLTALGGRLEGRLTGTIAYNGKPFSNDMKRRTGFVAQNDVLFPHLTVTETLVFTAHLRMPNSHSGPEKTAMAEAVVAQLGLTKCKDSLVGGPFLRGISGGEKKRVSIGQELLINPSLLLLDEPTSGLDSTTAQRIVSAVSDLARAGRTVLMTIHQPSSRLFYMFHKVLLLSEGNALYFGNGSGVMDYFAGIGYAPSVAMNPSDFLLDLANGLAPDDSHEDQATIKQRLVSAYKLNLHEKVKAEIAQESTSNRHSNNIIQNGFHQYQAGFGSELLSKSFGQWPTTWSQQFLVLFRRGIKERKHHAFSGLKIGQVLFISFLSGLLWWQCDKSRLQDQMGLLFFMSVFWGFFPVSQAIFTFPAERKNLEKERASGMYRLSSYFIGRTVADLPMELILPTIFVVITYWMAGFRSAVTNFVLTLLIILLNVLVSQGIGLAIGALVMNQRSASTLAAVIMMTFLLTGGYYVRNPPAFVSWIQYISSSHYTFKLLLGVQFKENDTYPCQTSSGKGLCSVGDFPPLKEIGFGGQAVSALIMVAMLVGYRLIAYIALMRIGVTTNNWFSIKKFFN